MTEIEAIPTRRSKRIFQKIKDDDWPALDFIAPDSFSTKRDELTGRGFVHYIENVTAIEFETLDDIKLYDSVAEKMGVICCASFNEFSRPFRGFSEEECSNSKDYFLLFKEVRQMNCNKNDDPGVNRDSIKKIAKSNKKLLSECKKVRSVERESSSCEPHGKLSRHLCRVTAPSRNPKLSEVGCLLTPVTSPNTSFDSLKVPRINFEFDDNIDDLLLTTVDSPASSQQELHHSKMAPLISSPYHTRPIDVSTIPYIYRCFAFDDCHNSNACANASSIFRLYIKLTSGKGRALSRFAAECLDQYKDNQDSNTIDRVAATIAASAVGTSSSTVLLPLNKKLISRSFPLSNILQSLESGIGEQSECSKLEKSACCAPNSTPEVLEMLIDPKRLGLLRSSVGKMLTNFDSSNVYADTLDPISSTISHHFVNKSEVLDSESTRERRNNTPEVTPALQEKRFLERCTNANHVRFIEISKKDSKTPKSTTNSDKVPTLRSKLKPSPLKSKHFLRSGSITVTDSILLSKVPNFQMVGSTASRTGKGPEMALDSESCSSDELYPRIVSTTSLYCAPKTSLTATTLDDGRSPCKRQSIASNCCHFPSNLRNVQISEKNHCTLNTLSAGLHPDRRPSVQGVIDLTASENETSCKHDSIVQHRGRSNKRKQPHFPHSLPSEKVIVIDDDPHENRNELIPVTSERGNPFGMSSTLASQVISPSMHNPMVSSILNANEQIIDLTSCSGIDVTKRHGESVLTNQHPSQNVSFTLNSLGKVIDLTGEDKVETPAVVTVEENPFSDNTDTTVPHNDDMSNERGAPPTKSVEIPNRKKVLENRDKSLPGLQELAVMCNTAPTLGFIRVIRCPTGELMLSETFTARVYKQFEDLKALNTYLNQRFEKMPGVKDRGPLEWILATAGVVKLKNVRPINPKVWFHPNDYILTKDGPADALKVTKTNQKHQNKKQKTKSIPGKTQTSSSSYKHVAIPQADVRNMVGEFAKHLQTNGRLIPAIKGHSATNNKPKTARFVSVLSNKKHIQQLEPISSENRQICVNNAVSDTKVIKLKKTTVSGSPIIKHSGSPKNEVTHTCDQLSTDKHISPQPKALTQRMAVLLEMHPNHIPSVASTTQRPANLLNGSVQSSNLIPSNEVQKDIHSKSSTSQNRKVPVGKRANQLPITITQSNVLSNPQSVVLLSNNRQASQTSSNSTQRSMDGMPMPRSPQIVQTVSLNKDTTSVQTKAQSNLFSKVYLKTLNNPNGGQSVVLFPTKQGGNFISRKSSYSLDKSSTLHAQKVLVNNQIKDSMQGNDHAQVRTFQNGALSLNCQTSQVSKVSSSNTLSTARTAWSVAQLPRVELTKSSSYENTSFAKPNVLLNGQTSQPTMAHLCKVPSTGTLGTLHTAQPVSLVSNKECGTSTHPKSLSNLPNSSLEKPSATQPVVVWVNKQSGEKTWRKILPHPSTSQTPLLGSSKGQSILTHHLTSGTIQSPPTIVDSVSQDPDRLILQPIIQISQTDLMSSGSTESVALNNPTASQKVTICPMTHPVKFFPSKSRNAQTTSPSNKSKLAAVQLSHARQSPNQSEQKTEKTGCTDAMIYFSSEGEKMKGISVQKFPLIVSKKKSNSVDTPKFTVAASSTSSGIFFRSNNKSVEFIRKQTLPIKLYSTTNKDKPPLKLHWTTLNVRKPSQP